MLIKFLRPEHVEAFMNGNIYFKNTGYFMDLEDIQGDKGIGDKYEGSFFRKFENTNEILVLEDEETGEKVELIANKGFYTERYEAVRGFQLTCFTGMLQEDFEKVDNSTCKLKSDFIEGLRKEFEGRVPVVIVNEVEFFRRLGEKLREKGINTFHSYVKYFDEYGEYPLKEDDYEKEITHAFFYKRKDFEHQKEYRIITRHPVPGDSLEIKIKTTEGMFMRFEDIDSLYKLFLEKKEVHD
ncbi:hypothetical protein [Bacillus badius]|uniref:hypothetical protein n=1 Tax=Bacillus badius TaxID=1455 RepID=UPI000596D652|nr:hypothetical protein [Bacillus badius]KIL74736.1 hypothetical protein SD78_1805 [Bacillus badius]